LPLVVEAGLGLHRVWQVLGHGSIELIDLNLLRLIATLKHHLVELSISSENKSCELLLLLRMYFTFPKDLEDVLNVALDLPHVDCLEEQHGAAVCRFFGKADGLLVDDSLVFDVILELVGHTVVFSLNRIILHLINLDPWSAPIVLREPVEVSHFLGDDQASLDHLVFVFYL